MARIYKNMTGTTLEYYSNNKVIESYDYDFNGNPVLGDPNVPILDKNYIINYMNSFIPQYYCSSINIEREESRRL